MLRTKFFTKWYSQKTNLITMKDWIDTTLSNEGTSTLIVSGQKVLPGEKFVVNGTTLVSGEILLLFEDTTGNTSKVAANFNQTYCN
jgi:hypothetical protein